MNSTRAETFSAKTGGPCCAHSGSCHGCVADCTMPAPYWKGVTDFAKASGHRLVFGLVPDVGQATSLIAHSANHNLPVFGYTFGNEEASARVADGYPVLRKAIDAAYPAGGAAPRPKLAGPDLHVKQTSSVEIMHRTGVLVVCLIPPACLHARTPTPWGSIVLHCGPCPCPCRRAHGIESAPISVMFVFTRQGFFCCCELVAWCLMRVDRYAQMNYAYVHCYVPRPV